MEVRGVLKTVSVDRNQQETGRNSLIFNILSGGEPLSAITLWDNDSEYITSGFAEI